VRREAVNLVLAGSTPVAHPRGRRVADCSPAPEAGKRWFESSRPHHLGVGVTASPSRFGASRWFESAAPTTAVSSTSESSAGSRADDGSSPVPPTISMAHRPMAGQRTLTPRIQVRVLVGQPFPLAGTTIGSRPGCYPVHDASSTLALPANPLASVMAHARLLTVAVRVRISGEGPSPCAARPTAGPTLDRRQIGVRIPGRVPFQPTRCCWQHS
jgi:hypothetical protein